jgi:ribosomal protein S10
MVEKAVILITGYDKKAVEDVVESIRDISETTGTRLYGPHCLPVKEIAGVEIRKCRIDIQPDERVIKKLFEIKIPEKVEVKVHLRD